MLVGRVLAALPVVSRHGTLSVHLVALHSMRPPAYAHSAGTFWTAASRCSYSGWRLLTPPQPLLSSGGSLPFFSIETLIAKHYGLFSFSTCMGLMDMSTNI